MRDAVVGVRVSILYASVYGFLAFLKKAVGA